jgi:AcrR family transcriptional regulator
VTTTQPGRRQYDSTLRRERAAQTRERIVTAGIELVRASIRDWNGVTLRAVAEHAGVNERTVYRHFANERALRDEVMHRLEKEAGVDLADMRLDDIADVTSRIFKHLSVYPLEKRLPADPTLIDAVRRQHDALLAAVGEHTTRWAVADRALVAAVLDVLWSLGAYERIVVDWQLDRDEAIRAIMWAVGLVTEAVHQGLRPPRAKRSTNGNR